MLIGLGDGFEIIEHGLRIGAVVQQGGDHHWPAAGLGQRAQKSHRHLAAFGHHVNAFALVAHGQGELHHFLVAGQARRHRQAAFAVVRRTGAAGKTDGTGAHGFAHQRGHGFNFLRRGRAFVGLFAHHPGANGRVSDVSGDVDGATLAFQHGQVLGKGFEIPVYALLQHIKRHAFDLGQVTHGQFAVLRPARCNGETAIADDGSGHSLSGGGANIRVPGDLCVKVSVGINDARHERQTLRLNHLVCAMAQA